MSAAHLLAAAHGEEGGRAALLHLLLNWPHWGFELISGGVIGAFLVWPAKRLLRHHDKHAHYLSHPKEREALLQRLRLDESSVSNLTQRVERLEAANLFRLRLEDEEWEA